MRYGARHAWLAAWLALCACAEAPDAMVCSTGRMVGASEGEDMSPGEACNACHAYANAGGEGGMDAPIFGFAGTVYETAHEPDGCAGGDAQGGGGARVEVVSATGKRYVAPVTRGGNFMLDPTVIAFPITARVKYGGRSRWMIDPIMTGDCNTCHSAAGEGGACGRIRLP